eukprot:TRINITY_DN7293_c0_g1_i8.p1 TRINITY_DN7293_c0_g1~~TRINITY_DN7293_c0_g1_i8.p1  ORF type:complete len:109 (+),score=28.15 TRINITY_DN7293_c0_g1_i8:150-476(+)
MIAPVEVIRDFLNHVKQAGKQQLAEKSHYYNFNFATGKPFPKESHPVPRFSWEQVKPRKKDEVSSKKRRCPERSAETASDNEVEKEVKGSKTGRQEELESGDLKDSVI